LSGGDFDNNDQLLALSSIGWGLMTAMSSKSIQDHIQSLSVEEQIDLLATLLDNTNSSEQTLTLAKSFLDAVGPERANELIEREDVWSILLGSYDRRMSSTTESKMTLRQKVEMVLGLGVVLLILMTPVCYFVWFLEADMSQFPPWIAAILTILGWISGIYWLIWIFRNSCD